MIVVTVNAKTHKIEAIVRGDTDTLIAEFSMLIRTIVQDEKATYCFNQAITIESEAAHRVADEKGDRHFDA